MGGMTTNAINPRVRFGRVVTDNSARACDNRKAIRRVIRASSMRTRATGRTFCAILSHSARSALRTGFNCAQISKTHTRTNAPRTHRTRANRTFKWQDSAKRARRNHHHQTQAHARTHARRAEAAAAHKHAPAKKCKYLCWRAHTHSRHAHSLSACVCTHAQRHRLTQTRPGKCTHTQRSQRAHTRIEWQHTHTGQVFGRSYLNSARAHAQLDRAQNAQSVVGVCVSVGASFLVNLQLMLLL